MPARAFLQRLHESFRDGIQRADIPADNRLFVWLDPAAVGPVTRHVFRDLDARYVVGIGADDRPFSGDFLVAHNFALDRDHLLTSFLTRLPADSPRIDSISGEIPAAS